MVVIVGRSARSVHTLERALTASQNLKSPVAAQFNRRGNRGNRGNNRGNRGGVRILFFFFLHWCLSVLITFTGTRPCNDYRQRHGSIHYHCKRLGSVVRSQRGTLAYWQETGV